MSSSEEPFPVDATIKVIKGQTIYKNKKWWFAVILANSFGHNKVMIFQWQWAENRMKDDATGKWVPSGQYKWKRKQKITFNFAKDWEAAKPIVDAYMKEGNL